MNKSLIGLFTMLLIPFMVIPSVVLVALLAALVILVSPILVLGGAIKTGLFLFSKISDWLMPNSQSNEVKSREAVIGEILGIGALILLSILPVTVGVASLSFLAGVVLLPTVPVVGAFMAAQQLSQWVTALFPDTKLNSDYELIPEEEESQENKNTSDKNNNKRVNSFALLMNKKAKKIIPSERNDHLELDSNKILNEEHKEDNEEENHKENSDHLNSIRGLHS